MYEKLRQGIWSYNGVFHLVDAWQEQDGGRSVFKFKLLAVQGEEDFRGLKIRAYGAETAKLFKLMGAVPLTMPLGEVYVALQRGLVDGVMTSVDSVHAINAQEVLDYGTRLVVSAYVPCNYVLVNLDSFNALPQDLQQIILDAAHEAEDRTKRASVIEVGFYLRWMLKTHFDVSICIL